MAIFNETGSPLRRYPLDAELLQRESTVGSGARAQPVRLTVSAFCTDELRQIRLAHIRGGSLQVLNFCAFPSLAYGLPSFAADLVTLPGGHLIALDFAPNRDPATDDAFAPGGALAAVYARHRLQLPDGGPIPEAAAKYFSPYFLWSRLPTPESDAVVADAVLQAFDDYLRAYLELVRDATPLEDEATRSAVRKAQLSYARYRAEEDPARPMLTRLFGSDFAERLIHEALFDLPFHLDSDPAVVDSASVDPPSVDSASVDPARDDEQ